MKDPSFRAEYERLKPEFQTAARANPPPLTGEEPSEARRRGMRRRAVAYNLK